MLDARWTDNMISSDDLSTLDIQGQPVVAEVWLAPALRHTIAHFPSQYNGIIINDRDNPEALHVISALNYLHISYSHAYNPHHDSISNGIIFQSGPRHYHIDGLSPYGRTSRPTRSSNDLACTSNSKSQAPDRWYIIPKRKPFFS